MSVRRNTALLGLLVLLVIPAIMVGQSLPCRTYGEVRDERCLALEQSAQGNYVLAGWTTSFSMNPTDTGMLIIKTDTAGIPIRARFNAQPNGGTDVITSSFPTNDGGYVFCGYTKSFGSGTNYDVVVIKTDANLTQQWGYVYAGSYGGDEQAWSIIQTMDGAYTLTGWGLFAGFTETMVMRLYPNGLFRAAWYYARNGQQQYRHEGLGICELPTPAPKYAVVGRFWNQSYNNWDAYILRIDSAGNPILAQTFLGPMGDDEAWSVVYDPTSATVATAGWTQNYGPGAPTNSNIFVWRQQMTGPTMWRKVYGWANGNEKLRDDRALVATSNGYAFNGMTNSVGMGLPNPNFLLTRIDPLGNVIWSRVHPSDTTHNQADEGYPLTGTMSGGFAAAGWTNSFGVGLSDFHLVTVDANGNRQRCVIPVTPDTASFPEQMLTMTGGYEYMTLTPMLLRDTLVRSVEVCSVLAVIHNVGTTSILVPTGTVDSGTVLTPACSTFNFGTATESYTVRMKIGLGYNVTAGVTAHAPGTWRYITFPTTWTAAPRGNVPVSCSTELSGDIQPSNDKKTGAVTVRVHDVGAIAIVNPKGTIDSGLAVTPLCTLFNFGTVAEGYTARLKIGTAYNNTVAVTGHPAGTAITVTFPTWIATPLGTHSVSCSTELATDMKRSNDKVTGQVTVAAQSRHNVGCTRILAPSGTIDSGTVTTPACSVFNSGTSSESYTVRMKVGTLYNQTASVTSHAPSTLVYVTFPTWAALPVGNLVVTCSTELAGDENNANDKQTGAVTVRRPTQGADVGCTRIVAPSGTVSHNAVIAPSCSLYNFGTTTAGYYAHMLIGTVYHESVAVTGHTPGTRLLATFPSWTATPSGTYPVTAYSNLSGDLDRSNDTASGSVTVRVAVQPGWIRKADVPPGIKGKRVKDGGSLTPVMLHDSAFILAFKGNNTNEVYRYDPAGNSWITWDSIPGIGRAGRKKYVKKGASLTSRTPQSKGATSTTSATKGGNTLEYWEYYPETDNPWTQRADVPLGQKAIKEGSGLAAVPIGDTTYIYLLKGSATTEFHRYNPRTDVWQTMNPAPLGTSGRPFKNGSSICYNPDAKVIYALKAGYNEFFAYDVPTNEWTTKTSLPLVGSSGRKKKAKDGSSQTYHAGTVFTQKGGNTVEFYKYSVSSNQWTQAEDILLIDNKRVKGGGSLTYLSTGQKGSYDGCYSLVGNNTFGFEYYPETFDADSRQVQAGSSFPTPHSALRVSPNPFSRTTTISYTMPRAGNASLKLYDVTGKLVTTLSEGHRTAGNSSFTIHRSSFSSGIYLLELETPTATATTKLVIE